jgi:hypothetical protein
MPRIQSSQATRYQTVSSRQKADIIFVVDRSYSMCDCIEGIKKHIVKFVDGLEADQQVRLDWRLALVAADSSSFSILDFTTDTRTFQQAVSRINLAGDECMLPALDLAANFHWRERVHKAIIFFTDEPVAGGSEITAVCNGIPALRDKLTHLKVELYAFTPDCPDYLALTGNLPRAKHRLDVDFGAYDFGDLLATIGKSVSRSASQGKQNIAAVNRLTAVYDLRQLGIEVETL